MEWFSPEFFTALLSIIILDLVLAGDNAIMIGLAARNLPKETQKKVIIFGTVAAIGIRILLTALVVWLLSIPFLMLGGGIVLLWIAYHLLVDKKKQKQVEAAQSYWGAIRTIVLADVVMGLDNVLAIAGAAHGSIILVVIGLLISVPIIIWGSTIIVRYIERYPVIIVIGAAVLAWTATKMITGDPYVQPFFQQNPTLKWLFVIVTIAAVLLLGRRKRSFA